MYSLAPECTLNSPLVFNMYNSRKSRKDSSIQEKRNKSIIFVTALDNLSRKVFWGTGAIQNTYLLSIWHAQVHNNCLIYLVHVHIFNYGLKLISVLFYSITLGFFTLCLSCIKFIAGNCLRNIFASSQSSLMEVCMSLHENDCGC